MEVKIHIYFIRWNAVSRKVDNILIILFTDDFKNFQDCQSLKKGENEKEIIHLKVILKKISYWFVYAYANITNVIWYQSVIFTLIF